jgi:hypothetical protein
VSPDGRTLLFCHVAPVRDLTITGIREDSEGRTVTDRDYHLWPRFSPSGKLVASVVRREGEGEYLYITDVQTKKQVRLSDRAAAFPDWVDEDNVAYLHDDLGSTQVCVGNVTTGGNREWVRLPGKARWLALHRGTGKLAVTLGSPEGDQDLILCETTTGGIRKISAGRKYEFLCWFPDGGSISWSGPASAADNASSGIWILEIGRPAPQRIFLDGYAPVYTGDGKMVYFARIGEHAGLWRLDLRSAALNRMRDWRYVPFFDLRGDRLVFARDSGCGQIYSMTLQLSGTPGRSRTGR